MSYVTTLVIVHLYARPYMFSRYLNSTTIQPVSSQYIHGNKIFSYTVYYSNLYFVRNIQT